ncbi:MAG: hypothetical protein AB1599_09680 [Planctomycetota bacterium]
MLSSAQGETTKFSQYTFMSDELKKLSEEYCLGRYTELAKDLETFIRKNKEAILKFKADEVKNMGVGAPTDELAVKLFILKTRSINPATEIKTELAEIEKEIWYQGEKTKSSPDRNKVAMEWCKLHAPGWRDNWVFAALYVFEHDKPYYLKVLNS